MKCQYCRRGVRLASIYETRDGIQHADAYCSWCGRNLPGLSVEEAAAEEQTQTPARVHRAKPPAAMTKVSEAHRLSIEEMQARLRAKAEAKGYDWAKRAAGDEQ